MSCKMNCNRREKRNVIGLLRQGILKPRKRTGTSCQLEIYFSIQTAKFPVRNTGCIEKKVIEISSALIGSGAPNISFTELILSQIDQAFRL